jgi:hypothetical protein
MKKWIPLAAVLALLVCMSIAHSQATPHSATIPFTEVSAGVTSFNCYKSAKAGGPYTKYGTVTASPCVETSPTVGVPTFYVETALIGTNESANSNEVSGVGIGNGNPPVAQAVTEQ